MTPRQARRMIGDAWLNPKKFDARKFASAAVLLRLYDDKAPVIDIFPVIRPLKKISAKERRAAGARNCKRLTSRQPGPHSAAGKIVAICRSLNAGASQGEAIGPAARNHKARP